MIVNKITKTYITLSSKPNENWIGEEWYLVSDNSPLASKIIKLYPRYDFVLKDGELIDVTEVAKTDEEIKKEREEEIKAELAELDKTINRATEDLYVLTNLTAYQSIAEVINRKNELRKELSQI